MANYYFEVGKSFLSKMRFSEALPNLIRAYEEDNVCVAALERIYETYIWPYEDTFRENFYSNCREFSILDYEDCQIDFIPVPDACGISRFILFDKTHRQFMGRIDVDSFSKCTPVSKSFSGLLIADCWDIRELLPILQEKQWPEVYFVLNEEKERFMSFFKLLELQRIIPGQVHLFSTSEEMRAFFLANGSTYLPQRIIASDSEKYEQILGEIHTLRIQSRMRSDNILLSICIPTYNRGELALQAVTHALNSKFDAEIEIVVSNNGSTIGIEEYEKIKNLCDSRVQYYEFSENRGFSANIVNCLEKAQGNFAVIICDEDRLAIENVEAALEYLNCARDIGACVFNFKGTSPIERKICNRFKSGCDAVIWAFRNACHTSGNCYNVDFLKKGLLKKSCLYETTDYFRVYPQVLISVLLGGKYDVANTGIELLHYGKPAPSTFSDANGILTYAIPKERMRQEIEKVQLAADILQDDCDRVFLYIVHDTFVKMSGYMKGIIQPWISVCRMHYDNCMKILDKSNFKMKEELLAQIDNIFLDWLDCRRISKYCSSLENLKSSLRAQIARHLYVQGTAFSKINFEAIDLELDNMFKGIQDIDR